MSKTTLKEYPPENSKARINEQSTITKCDLIMAKFLARRAQCKPPSLQWIENDIVFQSGDFEENLKLYKDILTLVDILELSVEAQRITSSSGRQNRELTAILGNILLICSESPPIRLTGSNLPKTSDTCMRVLKLIKSLNFDIQPIHLQFIVRAANQEHEWSLASSLFREQTNPDLNGYTPIDSTLGSEGFLEMGLYAIAMNLGSDTENEDGFRAVRGVFHAVQEMSIVSPTDIEKYVMAAGSALGRSGHSMEFVNFVKTTTESFSDMGQALYAAVIYSCYVSKKYNIVLDLYEEVINVRRNGDNSAWQWEGKYFSIHPLCDELFLRSLYECSPEQLREGMKTTAISIYENIVKQGGTISPDAILGVLKMCGNDFDYNQALAIYQTVQEYDEYNSDWRISNPNIRNFLSQQESENRTEGILEDFKDRVLAETMLVCNKSGQYGLSILCILLRSDGLFNHGALNLDDLIISEHLLRCNPDIPSKPTLLYALTEALCGLQSYFDNVNFGDDDTNDDFGQSSFNPAWFQAYLHIIRLLIASHHIRDCNVELSKKDIYNISLATARMLRCLNTCNQSSVGLYVLHEVLAALQSNFVASRSMKDAFKSMLGWNTTDKTKERNFFLLISDELLSAMIETEYVLNCYHSTLDLFMKEIVKDKNPSIKNEGHGWTRSTNEAMKALHEMDKLDDVKRVYETLHPSNRNSETYLVMAKSLVEVQNWEGVAELYDHASGSGYVSEELCILAMKAVAKSSLNGKLSVLRNLVHDIAEHRCSKRGMKSTTWVADHYWEIKEAIGFQFARLLMSWNDRDEAPLNETRLACQHVVLKYESGQYIPFGAMKSIISYIQLDTNDLNAVLDSIPSEKRPKSCTLVSWIIMELMRRIRNDEEQKKEYQEILQHCLRFLYRNDTDKDCKSFIQLLEQRNLNTFAQIDAA